MEIGVTNVVVFQIGNLSQIKDCNVSIKGWVRLWLCYIIELM